MQRSSFRTACLVALLLPVATTAADVTTSGTLTVGAGGTRLDGDRPSFQQATQMKRGAFGGIEEFELVREDEETLFTFNLRLIGGIDDYSLVARLEKPEAYFIETGFEQFRVWYDGSGGYFRPRALVFRLYDEDLSLTRSKLWLAVGRYTANQTLLSFRYDLRLRNGTKNSTSWGDTNLAGAPFGTRSIVPAFLDLDERTQVVAADVANTVSDDVKWKVGARYAKTELNNQRNLRRRPGESADRIVTSKDQSTTDIFSAHGYYLRRINESLTLSGGALITDLDSKLGGSRIYGQTYDPQYDPAYVRRQQRDEGFFGLHGHSDLKQTVLNLNAVYLPFKHWSVRPSVRFENLHQKTLSEFVETNVGGGASLPAILEEVEGFHKKQWNEFAESLEIRYTGKPNWTFNFQGDWVQGEGNLEEERILHTGVRTIDRDTDITRRSQKYSTKGNWYARPGLTVALQYYYKVNVNDYDTARDNTLPGTADRYPAFITDQDFETHDFNVRVSWRATSRINLVTRYDRQRSTIVSQEMGLAKTRNSELNSHILSQNLTWTPTGRLYLTGSINFTWDQLKTPAYLFVQHADNNYVNGSVAAGYALAKKDDIYVDYSFYRANNFVDNSATSLPLGADERQQAAFITWVRRQSEHLIYTLKYGYMTKADHTYAGLNDFDAQLLYGKVQYRF
jgi:hypothetical protein